jgi:hypothetical protein
MNTCKINNCKNEIRYVNSGICNYHYKKMWSEAHKDRVKESSKRWAKNNPDKVRLYSRRAAAKNAKNVVTFDAITEAVKDRFFAKVEKTDTCWNWTSARTAYRPKRILADETVGYGVFNILNRPFYAHRLSFLMHNGYLTDGLVVDHLCENTLCVNPDHLRQITNAENSLRSPKHASKIPGGYKVYKTHCKHGHVRTEENRGKPCFTCYPSYKRNKKDEQ